MPKLIHPSFNNRPAALLYQALTSCGLVLAGYITAAAQTPLPPNSVNSALAMTAGQTLPNRELLALGRNDAGLNDVAIVSEDRLVAVGDRGVLLLSSNGGRNWVPLDSPTTANLRGVRFSGLGFGLIVGGWIGSDTRTSHAVLLRTIDTGKSWSAVSAPDLPRLIGLRVHDNHCIAWGDYSPRWRTSVFESLDGGLTWHGIPVPLGHIAAAGLSAAGEVVAVDHLGRSAATRLQAPSAHATTVSASPTIATPDKPLRGVHHTGDRWLAYGAAGELIVSSDGQHWNDIDIPLSRAARQLCQWQAAEQVGDDVWICGSPGSIVLHSTDRGVSWNVRRTGQSLPLTAIRFVDQNRGWATGPLGLILATRDGGRTWYAQRQRARRLGVLALCEASNNIPWSPLLAAAWDEQVAVAATVYQHLEPIEQAGFLPAADTLRQDAGCQVGLAGCSVNYHPHVSSAAFIERATVDLLSWRPDALLISHATAHNQSAANSLEASALAMLQLCAAPNSRLRDELGLAPWNVSKLVGTCPDEVGQFTELSARVLRQPGIAIWDCMLPLAAEDRAAAQSLSMRTLWSQSQSKSAFASLMGAIAPNPETERQVAIRNIGNYQLMMGRVHRGQSIQQLAQVPTLDKPLDQWSSDLDFVLRTVPAQELAPLLQLLAERLPLGTQWEKRRVVYQRLIDNGHTRDAANWGQLQLLKLEQCNERRAWEQSLQRSGKTTPQLAVGNARPLPIDQAAPAAPIPRGEPWSASPFGQAISDRTDSTGSSMVVPASASRPIADASLAAVQEPATTAPELWQHLLHQTSLQAPTWLARPDVQLLQYSREARKFASSATYETSDTDQLNRLLQDQQMVGWPQMATQEMALAANQTEQLRWRVTAYATSQPPILDGTLNDSCWSRAEPMQLTALSTPDQSSAQLQPTTIRWSYDESYLYLAIVTPHQSGSAPAPVVQRRGYDADLSQVDHVQLVLDTDRDYSTAIELAVSADGRTYDRCCGMSEYNPKWHVAVQSGLDHWSAEVAIELQELTLDTQLIQQAWAVSARRLHPTGTSQSWSQLRTHAPYLHASGLMLFTDEVAQSHFAPRN